MRRVSENAPDAPFTRPPQSGRGDRGVRPSSSARCWITRSRCSTRGQGSPKSFIARRWHRSAECQRIFDTPSENRSREIRSASLGPIENIRSVYTSSLEIYPLTKYYTSAKVECWYISLLIYTRDILLSYYLCIREYLLRDLFSFRSEFTLNFITYFRMTNNWRIIICFFLSYIYISKVLIEH